MSIQSNPNRQSRKNKLELIRYVCEDLSKRKTQGAICRMFGYISQVYEQQIKFMDNQDKVNSSPSAYEILVQENLKLNQKLEIQKERQIDAEKEHKKEIEKLKHHQSMILKELHEKIDQLKSNKQPTKETREHNGTESDESDIFEGLSESKKERIMAEVAELYEANIALQVENNVLKK